MGFPMKNDASKKMAGLGYLEGGLSVDREARPNGPRGSAEMLESINFLRFVLDNVYSGIIVCNEQRQIIFMNQVYAELLRIDPQEAVGQDIKEYFPDSRLSHVLATGIPELGQRCSLKTEALLLVNRIPLKQNGKVVGAILQTVLRDYKDFTLSLIHI